jgi:hypothetical protein
MDTVLKHKKMWQVMKRLEGLNKIRGRGILMLEEDFNGLQIGIRPYFHGENVARKIIISCQDNPSALSIMSSLERRKVLNPQTRLILTTTTPYHHHRHKRMSKITSIPYSEVVVLYVLGSPDSYTTISRKLVQKGLSKVLHFANNVFEPPTAFNALWIGGKGSHLVENDEDLQQV